MGVAAGGLPFLEGRVPRAVAHLRKGGALALVGRAAIVVYVGIHRAPTEGHVADVVPRGDGWTELSFEQRRLAYVNHISAKRNVVPAARGRDAPPHEHVVDELDVHVQEVPCVGRAGGIAHLAQVRQCEGDWRWHRSRRARCCAPR